MCTINSKSSHYFKRIEQAKVERVGNKCNLTWTNRRRKRKQVIRKKAPYKATLVRDSWIFCYQKEY